MQFNTRVISFIRFKMSVKRYRASTKYLNVDNDSELFVFIKAGGIKLLPGIYVKRKYTCIMVPASLFSKFVNWLKSPEGFGSVSKSIPGEWQLYEYYVDLKEDLINLKEADLKNNKESLKIEFSDDEQFEVEAQLPLSVFKEVEKGTWSIHRNFITFIHPSDFRKNIEFQFAFYKGDLKLLKKDEAGKIDFFGFFRQPEKEKLK
ncbi:DUF5004 domain-containing protein [Maribellus mangrovi]|uniref:DUF5004 domain-containing protein n=1 Tax=Maribellus mangrovi TaxID=3133146 RepID=UPI0030ED9A01